MARKTPDTLTMGLPGMEKFAPTQDGRGKIKKVERFVAAPEYGGDKAGIWKGYSDPQFAALAKAKRDAEDIGLFDADAEEMMLALGEDDPNADDNEIVDIFEYTLRPYQERAIKKALWAISGKNPDKEDRCAVVMATGTGKTLIFSELSRRVCQDFGRKVLIICHQIDVVKQWIKTLKRLGIYALREQGTFDAATKLGSVKDVVVVACVDTMKGKRMESWPADFFDLLIHDECDLAMGASWTKIVEYFQCKHIGITATPDLRKGGTIKKLFKKIAYTYQITQAIKDGWLVRPIEKRARNKAIDLSKLRLTAGDFNLKDIAEMIAVNVGALAETSMDLMEDRPTIAFTPTVFTAQALAAAFNSFGVSAVAIYGNMKEKEREEIINNFGRGKKYQVICNCAIVTRGVDIPCAECIIMARPTTSRSLWTQMVGRVLRTYTDEETGYVKESALIINFAWKFQKQQHKLNFSLDLFKEEETSEEVMERARSIYETMMNEEGEVEIDPQEIIKFAEDLVQKDIEARIQFRLQNIKAMVTTLDPLAMDILDVPKITAVNFMAGKPASDKQIAKLQAAGYDTDEMKDMDARMAYQLIAEVARRRAEGLATWRQVKALIKTGVDYEEARRYSFDEASAYLDANMSRNRSNMSQNKAFRKGGNFRPQAKLETEPKSERTKWVKTKD